MGCFRFLNLVVYLASLHPPINDMLWDLLVSFLYKPFCVYIGIYLVGLGFSISAGACIAILDANNLTFENIG